jgi:glutathione S-transferase
MLTIYGVHRSRASRPIWLAYEMGLAFRHVPVIQAYRLADPHAPDAPLNTRSPAFLAINPNGHVPSIDDDGLMGMWALWAATEVEPHSIQILYHRVGKPSAERDPAVAEAAIAALRGPFAVLDRHLAAGGFVVGERFTVADINLAEVVRYAMPAPELFDDAPALRAGSPPATTGRRSSA